MGYSHTTPSRHWFNCSLQEVLGRVELIDPITYGKTRNFLDGAVTWLSPFVTHGIINTCEIARNVSGRVSSKECHRLFSELAWREYFHRTWQCKGSEIFEDIRQPQVNTQSRLLPRAVLCASTGINSVDHALNHLYEHGTMHNHARMWVAAIVGNMGQTHWREAARFFHYHLLDGDLASNTLSWQWIVGTFSHKKYVANQDNINKFSRTTQHNSWLDVPYDAFNNVDIPHVLKEREHASYDRVEFDAPVERLAGTVALRSIWNLDPRWQSDVDQQLVFVDADWLQCWPLSQNRKAFILHWAKQCNATVVQGTIEQLYEACEVATVVRQEYPACDQWPGRVEHRPWLFPLPDKSFTSFSQFFKQVRSSVGV